MSQKRSRTLRWARAFVLVQIALPLMLLGCKNSVLFYPWDSPTAAERLPVVERAGRAELFRAERPDGRVLTGYDVRPADGGDTPVLLYFHGNAGNVAHRAPWLAQLVEQSGLRVVLASYSGYGGNEGSPSEETIYADALAQFDAVVASGVAPAQIVVYGESIGGGPASYVATEREPGGLVLQSTLSSLSSMAWSKYWWIPLAPLFVIGDFPNAERAAAASERCPVLIVHGTVDGVIPFSEGESLAAAAPKAEFLPIEGADHNDLWYVGGRTYVETLTDRVRRWTSD